MAIRLERLRVQEALNARDVAVGRLADACASVREKTKTVEALREERVRLRKRLDDCDGHDKENVHVKTDGEDPHGPTGFVEDLECRFGLLQVTDGLNVVQRAHGNVITDMSGVATNVPQPPRSPFNAFSPLNVDAPDSPWAVLEGGRQVHI